jgi:hypothetical protein
MLSIGIIVIDSNSGFESNKNLFVSITIDTINTICKTHHYKDFIEILPLYMNAAICPMYKKYIKCFMVSYSHILNNHQVFERF